MKALILVGGFGTRLRPLTLSIPKPLVEFANKPILYHQIEALVRLGVKEIILAINYQPEVMMPQLKELEQKHGITIIQSQEEEPLGTAGPIRLAKELLLKDATSPYFYVFNSDIVCEYSFDYFLDFHKSHGREASMLTTHVEDPSKFGVVVANEDGQVMQFQEKPREFLCNRINAGLYIFNYSIIDKIQLRPSFLERDVFPKLAEEGQLFCTPLKGLWMDIAQPKDYITGTKLFLQFLRDQCSDEIAKGDNIIGNVMIHPTAQVDISSVIGPNVVIGEGCIIQKGVRISDAIIFEKTLIKAHAFIRNSMIGRQSNIGQWVRIEGVSVVAEDVFIKDEIFINESFILPHKNISSSIPNAGTIVM
eukprot:403338422